MVSVHHIRLIQVSNFLDLNIYAKTPWGPRVSCDTDKMIFGHFQRYFRGRLGIIVSVQTRSIIVPERNASFSLRVEPCFAWRWVGDAPTHTELERTNSIDDITL